MKCKCVCIVIALLLLFGGVIFGGVIGGCTNTYKANYVVFCPDTCATTMPLDTLGITMIRLSKSTVFVQATEKEESCIPTILFAITIMLIPILCAVCYVWSLYKPNTPSPSPGMGTNLPKEEGDSVAGGTATMIKNVMYNTIKIGRPVFRKVKVICKCFKRRHKK